MNTQDTIHEVNSNLRGISRQLDKITELLKSIRLVYFIQGYIRDRIWIWVNGNQGLVGGESLCL